MQPSPAGWRGEEQRGARFAGWASGAIAVLTIAVFWSASSNGFVSLDDHEYLTANRHVQAGLSLAGVRWALTTFDVANWHPLTWISYQLDWTLFGGSARALHLENVVLHAANAALLLLFLWRTTGARWPSACAAALFALHPLRVESVAWLSERKDVLSLLFGLIALHLYAASVRRRSLALAAGALAAFALGLMAKPMLVSLPLVLVLLDFWPLGRFARETPARIALGKAPWAALAAASAVLTLKAQAASGAVEAFVPSFARSRWSLVTLAWAGYLEKTIWPLRLSAFYPVDRALPPLLVPAAISALAVASIAAAFSIRQRRPSLFVGWSWFCVTLIPVLGAVRVGRQAMADRYTYLPSIGLCIALAFAFEGANERVRRVALGACAAALAVLSALTVRQIGTWRDSETLFTHALAVDPHNGFAANSLGQVRFHEGRAGEAEALFRQATRDAPDLVDGWGNLGSVLEARHADREAADAFYAAWRLRPSDARLEFSLVKVLVRAGLTGPADEHLRRLIRAAPSHASYRIERARLLAAKPDVAGAIGELEDGLRSAPGDASLRAELERLRAAPGVR